jgi:hypothetical protein
VSLSNHEEIKIPDLLKFDDIILQNPEIVRTTIGINGEYPPSLEEEQKSL